MSTSTIDYDKLAAQHGGSSTVDYDALAAQHGGSSSEPAARFGPQEEPSTLDLYKQALFNPKGSGAASGVTGDILQAGGRAMQSITAPILHPLDTAAGLYNSLRHPIDTANQRIDEFKQEWQQDPGLALANAGGDVLGGVEGVADSERQRRKSASCYRECCGACCAPRQDSRSSL